MDVILRIDVDVFSILFAFVLLLGSRSRNDRPLLDYRLFILLIETTILELLVDSSMMLLDGSPPGAGRILLACLSTLYYLAHPVPPMLYAMYAAYQVTKNARRLRSRMPLFALPALASAALSLASPFTGWFFGIDAAGRYQRGPLFLAFAIASYSYFAFAFFYVLARRKEVDARTLAGLLVFPLPPMVGGILQANYYGLVLIWPATVLSLLLIHVNIQQRKLSSDYLTGAYNRRRLDDYLESLVREPREARFAGILADLDDFKSINDQHGHAAGDAALVSAVRLLKASLRTEDFLARYAGDEFVAILPVAGEEELAQIVDRIRARFAEHSPADGRYRLSCSIGAAVFDPALDEDGDKFIERLDKLMYSDKQAKKAQWRRG